MATRYKFRWTLQYIVADVPVIEVDCDIDTPLRGWDHLDLDDTTSFELCKYKPFTGHQPTGCVITKSSNPPLWQLLMKAANADLDEMQAEADAPSAPAPLRAIPLQT